MRESFGKCVLAFHLLKYGKGKWRSVQDLDMRSHNQTDGHWSTFSKEVFPSNTVYIGNIKDPNCFLLSYGIHRAKISFVQVMYGAFKTLTGL